jgi:hypothetical protein
VLIAYVQACDGDVAAWEDRWAKLGKSKKGAAALPAAGQSATDDDPGAERGPGEAEEPGRSDGSAQSQPPSGEVYVITSARPRDDQW